MSPGASASAGAGGRGGCGRDWQQDMELRHFFVTSMMTIGLYDESEGACMPSVGF